MKTIKYNLSLSAVLVGLFAMGPLGTSFAQTTAPVDAPAARESAQMDEACRNESKRVVVWPKGGGKGQSPRVETRIVKVCAQSDMKMNPAKDQRSSSAVAEPVVGTLKASNCQQKTRRVAVWPSGSPGKGRPTWIERPVNSTCAQQTKVTTPAKQGNYLQPGTYGPRRIG